MLRGGSEAPSPQVAGMFTKYLRLNGVQTVHLLVKI